jgi:glycosyltransferase involved in cell wall biosynthesis
MKHVAIITRAYQRLEYTIACINAVKDHTRWGNYTHYIIDNNSTDGTRQWLDWITSMSSNYYPNLKPVHMDRNLGDWKGMIHGAEIAEDADYIVQLDNDITVPENWLTVMIEVLEQTGVGCVTLKRNGVQQVIEPTDIYNIQTSGGTATVGNIGVSVACWVVRAKDFNPEVPKAFFLAGAINRKCLKIINFPCQQIEGWNGTEYRQQKKYHKCDIYQKPEG